MHFVFTKIKLAVMQLSLHSDYTCRELSLIMAANVGQVITSVPCTT